MLPCAFATGPKRIAAFRSLVITWQPPRPSCWRWLGRLLDRCEGAEFFYSTKDFLVVETFGTKQKKRKNKGQVIQCVLFLWYGHFESKGHFESPGEFFFLPDMIIFLTTIQMGNDSLRIFSAVCWRISNRAVVLVESFGFCVQVGKLKWSMSIFTEKSHGKYTST